MLEFLRGVFALIADVFLALVDLVSRRRRRLYAHKVTIHAPVDVVWRLLTADKLTIEAVKLTIFSEPLPGVENGRVGWSSLEGQAQYGRIGYIEQQLPERWTIVQTMLREHTEPKIVRLLGEDDHSVITLAPAESSHTVMSVTRELTHLRAGTRIAAPLQNRNYCWMIKQQAELEAGNTPRANRKLMSQALWFAAAVASFWWMFGMQDALILVAVIVLHELGHAVTMLATGNGVHVVALVPFFGGVAVPKRNYRSESEHVLVALMGPGLSLIPTLFLIWYAQTTETNNAELAAHASFLFAIVNGLNLLPVTPLDGSVAINAILGRLHSAAGRALAWVTALAGLAFGVWLLDPVLTTLFVLTAVQLAVQASLVFDQQIRRLSWFEAAAWTLGFAALVATYAWAISESYALKEAFAA